MRTGLDLSAARWSALAEGTLALVPAYFDGVRGDRSRSRVNDPETVELYHAWARYAAPAGSVTAGRQVIAATLGYEVLGADHGVALTSVQTPVGTLFRFQGWADKFTTMPPDGVRDGYPRAVATWPLARPNDSLALTATVHRFESDRLVRHYGDELDLLAAWKRGRTTFSARFAGYRADRFATDTRKA